MHFSKNSNGILTNNDIETFHSKKSEDTQKSQIKKIDCTIHIEVENKEKVIFSFIVYDLSKSLNTRILIFNNSIKIYIIKFAYHDDPNPF